jgi:two-component sensor histidine kinase/ligand-binding sensor protein
VKLVESKGQLLDLANWTEVLKLYAQAMHVAVALTDAEGRLMGICHNPQPIWSLARAEKPDWDGRCIFCLNSNGPSSGGTRPDDSSGEHCTAAAEARRTGSVVLVHDLAGLAHVAIPLVSGDSYFGTLLAGQVFDRYPESLALGRTAKAYDLSEQGLWTVARRQVPVSRSNLSVFGSLLHTLGQALLDQRNSAILKGKLFVSDAELHSANEELATANANLLVKVAELSKSNGEKSVLLQEVHHRVNNNLQVIASLLRMQAESFGDNQLADALRTSQMRIESMALIHAQLYDASDLRQVDFADYSTRLAENLLLSYGVDRERIKLLVNMGALTLSVDQAIPAGLILGELIANAIKYAFPGQRSGTIRVEGSRCGKDIEMMMSDDGVGIPEIARSTQPVRPSRGLQIVSILCGQLHARLEQTRGIGEPGPGALFRISFPAS